MNVCMYMREKERMGEKGRENDRNGKRKKCGAAHVRSSMHNKKQD